MQECEIQIRRWRRVEYEQLVEKGIFMPGEHVELIDGLLIVAEPQSAAHYTTIRLVERALAHAFGEGWDVRTQAPIALDDTSEPEPDVAVVAGGPRDYARAHPTSALLVVEVSDATLAFDRNVKASLYAAAGIPEYWVVDCPGESIEVHRSPERGAYRDVSRVAGMGTIALAAFPDVALTLAEIFA
jgi:Uma2 family endonuclease